MFDGPLVAAAADDAVDNDEIIILAAYNVKADRIEDFGLRIDSAPYPEPPKIGVGIFFSKFAPMITAVLPNTAAARVGLQPGERILKSEGRSTVGGPISSGKSGQWYKTQKRKWEELASGETNVSWTLEVESTATKVIRTVKLVVPTPPPHWGASVWQMPEGRNPSTVAESGPLAELSRGVLDNGVLTWVHDGFFQSVLGPSVSLSSEPTGYEWSIGSRQEGEHQIFVTQFRGRTDVVLETASRATGRRLYLTSPSGALERAWRYTRQEKGEVPVADARAGFEHELELWTTKVEKGTGRWPFEVKPGCDANVIFAVLAPKGGDSAVEVVRPFADEFLKLRSATEAERAMFFDAYGKLGTEHDHWAYTETSHGFEDKRVTVMRFDPSKPETERYVLLSIDGKPPTPSDVQRWRDDGEDTPKPLGDIPPFASLVDLKDLRICTDEIAAVVFELPIRSGRTEFPTEKFQALFRVNKTSRGFEDFSVKLRGSMHVAGIAKVTDAGLEARFEAFGHALAPQPVRLKMGGGVSVLFVNISRASEITRTDFKLVVPFVDPLRSSTVNDLHSN